MEAEREDLRRRCQRARRASIEACKAMGELRTAFWNLDVGPSFKFLQISTRNEGWNSFVTVQAGSLDLGVYMSAELEWQELSVAGGEVEVSCFAYGRDVFEFAQRTCAQEMKAEVDGFMMLLGCLPKYVFVEEQP